MSVTAMPQPFPQPTLGFITAAWLGMSAEEIAQGIAAEIAAMPAPEAVLGELVSWAG